MKLIKNNSTNPYLNLALEEYLLKHFNHNFFMLWRNSPSVIIGRNQNTLSEINLDYIESENIPVVRRITGGGAVYHDLGNINFTFITNDSSDSFGDYAKFTAPIIGVLEQLGVNASLKGRNDLVIDNKKFSGNAQYIYKNRILHHGTLLFSSNITDMTRALMADKLKISSKAIKSISSRVTNISQHLKQKIKIEEFIRQVYDYLVKLYPDSEYYELTACDLNKVKRLAADKYYLWSWNYGSSPDYSYKNKKLLGGGLVEVRLSVNDGIIRSIKFYGDFFSKKELSDIESALIGVNHNPSKIKEVLDKFDLNNYFANISAEEILSVIYS